MKPFIFLLKAFRALQENTLRNKSRKLTRLGLLEGLEKAITLHETNIQRKSLLALVRHRH